MRSAEAENHWFFGLALSQSLYFVFILSKNTKFNTLATKQICNDFLI